VNKSNDDGFGDFGDFSEPQKQDDDPFAEIDRPQETRNEPPKTGNEQELDLFGGFESGPNKEEEATQPPANDAT